MAWLRLWLTRLLTGVDIDAALKNHAQNILELQERSAQQDAALGEVISELARIRNASAETPEQRAGTGPQVRRLSSWREFRAAVENQPQPILVQTRKQ